MNTLGLARLDRANRIVLRAAQAVALVGGAVLLATMLITALSIAGRSLSELARSAWLSETGLGQWLQSSGVGSITGSFDLVEAGIAFAVFAFLPLCQITAGHASVTLISDRLPAVLRRLLVLAVDLLFAWVLVVIALQLNEGMARAIRSGQTTFLLQTPVWWNYAACLAGACVAAAAGVWVALMRAAELLLGGEIIKETQA